MQCELPRLHDGDHAKLYCEAGIRNTNKHVDAGLLSCSQMQGLGWIAGVQSCTHRAVFSRINTLFPLAPIGLWRRLMEFSVYLYSLSCSAQRILAVSSRRLFLSVEGVHPGTWRGTRHFLELHVAYAPAGSGHGQTLF